MANGGPIYKGGRPYSKPGQRYAYDTGVYPTNGAPTDGTSGTLAGIAGPGSVLLRNNGSVYVNTNTKASPTWVSLGVGASGAVLTSPTITAPIYTDRKVLAASQTASANITPATLTGFSWTVVAGATYQFEVDLFTTQTTVGGLTLSFVLTTASLTSIAYGYEQTVTTTQGAGIGTTTTSGTKVIDNKTAAYTQAHVHGSFVVNAGGTFEWDFCQNTSAGAGDATLVLLGSTASLYRTA